jgi:hypothetical protein
MYLYSQTQPNRSQHRTHAATRIDDIYCLQTDTLFTTPTAIAGEQILTDILISDHFPGKVTGQESEFFGAPLPCLNQTNHAGQRKPPTTIRPMEQKYLKSFAHKVTTELHTQATTVMNDMQSLLRPIG